MKKIAMIAMLAGLGLMLAGCRSTMITTSTVKNYDPATGLFLINETTKKVEESRTPFVNKWVYITAWGYGFKIVLFDPQTGSFSPCVEAVGGRSGLNTMPVVGDDVNTAHESLYVEKSFWSNAASVVEYNRVLSGNMKDIEPSVKIQLKLEPNNASGTSLLTDAAGLAPAKIVGPR